ncbi:MAG TPA: hypothetical protein VM510_12180 [Caulifigura sp.]|nr:hypothetical protein [Caulifigura sp.]
MHGRLLRRLSRCKLPSLIFGYLPFSEITCDLGESPELSGVVIECSDYHIRPESAAILAKPPPLVFEATFFPGDFQSVLWPSAFNFFLWIKQGKMLPDDFVCIVLLDATGSGIPGGHMALRIENENRVVCDALDEELQQAVLTPCPSLLFRKNRHARVSVKWPRRSA